MKSTIIKKAFIALLMAVVVSVALFAVPAFAADPQKPSIDYSTVVFKDAVDLRFFVKSEDVGETKLLIWTSVPANKQFTKDTADDIVTAYNNDSVSVPGSTYKAFTYDKIAARQMGDTYYVCALYTDGTTELYSNILKYSVQQYAQNMLGTNGKPAYSGEKADTLLPLLQGMLDYGALSQKHFGYKAERPVNGTTVNVNVIGGTITEDGFTHGIYYPGDILNLTAPETDGSGNVFSHFEDVNGDKITLPYTVTGSEGASFTATAVYAPAAPDYGIYLKNGEIYKTYNHSIGDEVAVPGITVSGDSTNGYTYTLTDFNFTTTDVCGLSIGDETPTTLVLVGTNSITSGNGTGVTYAVEVYKDLVIKGDGSLTATANSSSGNAHGIHAGAGLTVESGTVKGIADDAAVSYGINVSGVLTVNNGEVTGIGGNATGNYSTGVYVYRAMTVTNGTVTGQAGTASSSSTGVFVQNSAGKLTVEGGTVIGVGDHYGIRTLNRTPAVSGMVITGSDNRDGSNAEAITNWNGTTDPGKKWMKIAPHDYGIYLKNGEIRKTYNHSIGDEVAVPEITVSGDGINGYTYTLTDFNFITTDVCGLYIGDETPATLVLVGTNSITSGNGTGNTYAVEVYNDLIIKGDGSLTATANSNTNTAYGINANAGLTVESGTVTGIAGNTTGSYATGIYVKTALTVNGGNVTGIAGTSGWSSSGVFLYSTTGKMTVTGGTVIGIAENYSIRSRNREPEVTGMTITVSDNRDGSNAEVITDWDGENYVKKWMKIEKVN